MRATSILCASLGLIAIAPQAASAPSKTAEAITYRCDDVVIVGTLRNVEDSYRSVEAEDDILGHGWITAIIRVDRVHYGKEEGATVHANYFEHAYLVFPTRQRHLVILRRADDGSFTIAAKHRWNKTSKSHLAGTCS